jgi:hypothetical protein
MTETAIVIYLARSQMPRAIILKPTGGKGYAFGYPGKEAGEDGEGVADCRPIEYNVIQEARVAATRRSRVITISMPPEMAASAEFLAQKENRTMSELFREAFRAYHAQRAGAIFDEIGKYAATRNPNGYTEDDVERLVHEVRAEMRAEREAKQALAS